MVLCQGLEPLSLPLLGKDGGEFRAYVHQIRIEMQQPAADPSGTSAGELPAGWYGDPFRRYEFRFWDGRRWTEHTATAGQQHRDLPVN